MGAMMTETGNDRYQLVESIMETFYADSSTMTRALKRRELNNMNFDELQAFFDRGPQLTSPLDRR